jgi:DNA-binding transcriptional LysR family regulator
VPLFAERRLAALPADHPLAQRAGLSTADLAAEPHLRYLQPAPVPGVSGPQRPLRSVEEKLEHVAAGHGIIVLPLSATQYYVRPDVVYIPVLDAELDQVYLASEATRRSKLITGFIRVAQQALPSSEAAPARARQA